MASTNISSNMSLPIPVVGVDTGPDWANNINSCFTIIDGHTHANGSGVQITPAAININSDLTFAQNNGTNFRSVRFFPQSSVLAGASDLGCLSVVGVDLYYNDVSGNKIRMTQGGNIAGTSGSIANLTSPASASYVSASSSFVWQSAANTPANSDGGSVVFRNIVANSKGLTLNPPASMAADYSLTLPSVPGSTLLVTLNSSGNFGTVANATIADTLGAAMTSTGALAIVGTMGTTGAQTIATNMGSAGANTVGNNMGTSGATSLANNIVRGTGSSAVGNVAVSSTISSYSNSTTSSTLMATVSLTVSASANPMIVTLIPNGLASPYLQFNGGTGGAIFTLLDGSTVINTIQIGSGAGIAEYLAPGSVSFMVFNLFAAGTTRVFNLRAAVSTGGSQVSANNLTLVAYELH